MIGGWRLSNEELAIAAYGAARVVEPVRPRWSALHPEARAIFLGAVQDARLRWYLGGEPAVQADLLAAGSPRGRVFLQKLADLLREEARRAEI